MDQQRSGNYNDDGFLFIYQKLIYWYLFFFWSAIIIRYLYKSDFINNYFYPFMSRRFYNFVYINMEEKEKCLLLYYIFLFKIMDAIIMIILQSVSLEILVGTYIWYCSIANLYRLHRARKRSRARIRLYMHYTPDPSAWVFPSNSLSEIWGPS